MNLTICSGAGLLSSRMASTSRGTACMRDARMVVLQWSVPSAIGCHMRRRPSILSDSGAKDSANRQSVDPASAGRCQEGMSCPGGSLRESASWQQAESSGRAGVHHPVQPDPARSLSACLLRVEESIPLVEPRRGRRHRRHREDPEAKRNEPTPIGPYRAHPRQTACPVRSGNACTALQNDGSRG